MKNYTETTITQLGKVKLNRLFTADAKDIKRISK